MTHEVEMQPGYGVRIQPHPTGCGWQVTSADGRTARGEAPTAGSARQCCDFTIATLEALRRVGLRRF